MMSASGHNWNKRFNEGPLETGFDASYITLGGIQVKTTYHM